MEISLKDECKSTRGSVPEVAAGEEIATPHQILDDKGRKVKDRARTHVMKHFLLKGA
jgi:hypothetical protein